MASNTNLTPETAAKLVRGQDVTCPNCGEAVLAPRCPHKKQHVEYQCTACGEIYHPCKLI